MSSLGEQASSPASHKPDDSKDESSTSSIAAAVQHDTLPQDSSTSQEREEEQQDEPQAAATGASAATLVNDVDNLSIGKQVSDAEETKVLVAQSSTSPVQGKEEASSGPTDEQTRHTDEEAESIMPQHTGSGNTVEPSTSNSNQAEHTTGTLASHTLTPAETMRPLEEAENADPLMPLGSTETGSDAPAATDQPSLASTETSEQPADLTNDNPGDESMAPPTPPSKDNPQPREGSHFSEPTPNLAGTDLLSTPAAQKVGGRADREALADPESVAAVAQAFGRDSPALRSSLDTPKRISTPNEFRQNVDQASALRSKLQSSIEAGAEQATKDAHLVSSEGTTEAHTTVGAEEKGKEAVHNDGASRGGIRIGKGPPPATQASEELPFDFNRFLEQMKHRSAQPVGEYVRSFIKGFSKKPYRTQDQIKLIFDFLDFIAARMRECDVWKNLSDSDFENAKEAMEKLVMNRLYPYTFTPAVLKEGRWAVQTDDLERDRVLRQRISLFGWLSEEHLDVPVGDHSRGFIEFSIQELLKINHYKAPRDKLICILNCCKVIFGMIRHLSTQENADTFIPVLIFVVLKANPEHLISNVEYISRFRNPDRLSSESGYYLSSLMGAIAFIETMDYTSLSNITQEEFERRVEEAVSSLPEPEPSAAEAALLAPPRTPPPRSAQSPFGHAEHQRSISASSVSAPSGPGEEAAKALPFTPMAASLADDTRAFFLRTGEAARTGLSRPMGALGRLINEGIEGIRTPSSNADSGASTERQNSPAPQASTDTAGMTASTSRSKLFGGLFGSLDTSNSAGQGRARAAGYPGQQQGARRSANLLEDEPQTPSTGDLLQDGFQPYHAGPAPGGASNAPPRLIRPNMPQRNYSIDDTMFDDDSAGRRNLMATAAGAGPGQREADYYDYDDDQEDEADVARSTPSTAAAEQMRRRMQMQQDFGRGLHDGGTPSRRATGGIAEGHEQLQPGRRKEMAFENAQTEQAIQRSLMDQERLDAAQADEAAQNSASVETLKSIFPTMDNSVIQMVLQGCEGNVETAIDRLLEMQ